MGWTQTTQHVERSKAAVLRFFYGETPDGTTYIKPCHSGGEQTTEIAAAALVGQVFYAVLRFKNPWQPEFGPWFGGVDRVAFRAEGFGYKDMTEDMGPVEATAPQHVLTALDRLAPHPPLSNAVQAELARVHAQQATAQGRESLDLNRRLHDLDPHRHARAWRAACRAHHAQQAQGRAVKPGTRLRFRAPIRFQSGARLDTFTLVQCGQQRVFQGEDGGLYRITGWQKLAYEVLCG
jgi:hypothetical protein